MISNRDLVEKTKPILKDSYFQVFISIVLASILPQIISSVSPQNLYLNIAVVWLSGYIQLGIAVFCLDVFNKGEGEFTTIFSRFNSLKPIRRLTSWEVAQHSSGCITSHNNQSQPNVYLCQGPPTCSLGRPPACQKAARIGQRAAKGPIDLGPGAQGRPARPNVS